MKFDNIVDRYDFLNHLLSVGQDYYWRWVMVKSLGPSHGDRVLDLATGTGDSAAGMVEKGVTVAGVDISFNMIYRAKQKITDPRYSVIAGSAYTIHETPKALKEIYRVLKNGGRMVFLEFSMPRGIIRAPYRFYLNRVLPLVAGVFSKRDAYDYLADSIEKFYSPEDFARRIIEAGFNRCDKRALSMGCVHIHIAYKD